MSAWTSTEVGYGVFATSEGGSTFGSFYPILAIYDNGWLTDPAPPYGNPQHSTTANYTVQVSTDAAVRLVASGRLAHQNLSTDGQTFLFVGERLRDFVMVASRRFVQHVDLREGIVVRASFLPEHETAAKRAIRLARDALVLFSNRFGPYAFEELDLLEVPLQRAAGVEYPGLILLSQDACEAPSNPFFDALSACFRSAASRIAAPAELVEYLEATCTCDLAPIVEEYLAAH